jgi:regulator of chromosome condensation
MATRRSSRSASTKPPTQATVQGPEKVLPRSRSQQPTKRREASSDRTPSPPPKRSRTAVVQKPENDPPVPARTRKPSSRTTKPPSGVAKPSSRTVRPTSRDVSRKKLSPPPAAKKPRVKLSPVPEAPAAPVPQQKPYFNPLPTPPPKARPGLQLFAWGAGNFGQFGMGPDVLGELDKPKKSAWVEQQMQEGIFGEVGAGLESVVGGGLHSLFIDEKGTVSSILEHLMLTLIHSSL